MKLFTLIVLLFCLKLYVCHEECMKMLSEHGQSLDCCNYPFQAVEHTSAKDCHHNSTTACDLIDCIIDKLGLFIDGKVNIKNAAELFLIGLDFLKISRGNWTAVVEQSAKTCETLSELEKFL